MRRLWICAFPVIVFLALPARADIAQDVAQLEQLWKAVPEAEKTSNEQLVGLARKIVQTYDPAKYPNQLGTIALAYHLTMRVCSQEKNHAEALRLAEKILAQPVPFHWCLEFILAGGLRSALALKQTDKALALLEQGQALLGPKLGTQPRANVSTPIVDVYLAAGRMDDAVAFIQELAGNRPALYSSVKFWEDAYRVFQKAGKATEAKQAAKLGFTLCAYTEADIAKGLELVTKAYTAEMNVAAANQFLAYQQDSAKPNPLGEVPLPEVTAEEKQALLETAAAAGQWKTDATISVHLMLGEFDEALAVAREMLIAGGAAGNLDAALIQIARCFKAKDMNLIRANQFLEYARSGQGKNPLDEF